MHLLKIVFIYIELNLHFFFHRMRQKIDLHSLILYTTRLDFNGFMHPKYKLFVWNNKLLSLLFFQPNFFFFQTEQRLQNYFNRIMYALDWIFIYIFSYGAGSLLFCMLSSYSHIGSFLILTIVLLMILFLEITNEMQFEDQFAFNHLPLPLIFHRFVIVAYFKYIITYFWGKCLGSIVYDSDIVFFCSFSPMYALSIGTLFLSLPNRSTTRTELRMIIINEVIFFFCLL